MILILKKSSALLLTFLLFSGAFSCKKKGTGYSVLDFDGIWINENTEVIKKLTFSDSGLVTECLLQVSCNSDSEFNYQIKNTNPYGTLIFTTSAGRSTSYLFYFNPGKTRLFLKKSDSNDEFEAFEKY